MRLLKFKFKFLTRNANANKPLEIELVNRSVTNIDDINVFINHSVKILTRNMNTNTTKPLEKDKNDKNVFVNLQAYCSSFLPEMVRLRLRLNTIADTNTLVNHFANEMVRLRLRRPKPPESKRSIKMSIKNSIKM